MTSKTMLSVERDLLERAVSAVIVARGPGSPTERDLRAILDKPADPSKFVGAAQYWSENEQALRDVCRFEGLKGLVYQVVRDRDRSAAQHQGEPVAELQVAFFEHGSMARINWFTPSEFESGATKLYAERPAPVAVVMPDSLNTDEGYSVEAANWYNLALDDVARLNGVKP